MCLPYCFLHGKGEPDEGIFGMWKDRFHPRGTLQDLLGCEVKDADTGKEYGKLCDITETGANRVYHIRFADGKVRLAPDIPQVVLRLAPEEGVIEIRPLAGLFDDVTEDDYEV